MPHLEGQQLEILQKLHDVEGVIRESLEQVQYQNALKNTCLLDRYIEGKLSLIFNLHTRFHSDDMRLMGFGVKGDTFVYLTGLISYREVSNSSDRDQFEKQEMFVGNIDVVKRVDQTILPSIVRLYVGDDGVKEGTKSGVYFDAMKGVFNVFPLLANRELIVVGDCRGNVSLNSIGPSVIEGDTQIVDGVSGYQGQLQEAFGKIGLLMLNKFCSGITVFMDCGDITFLKRQNSGFQVTNMLLGPINLESGVSKRCAHAA